MGFFKKHQFWFELAGMFSAIIILLGFLVAFLIYMFPSPVLDYSLCKLNPTVDYWINHYKELDPDNSRLAHLNELGLLIEKRLKGTGFITNGGKKFTGVIENDIELIKELEEISIRAWKRIDELWDSDAPHGEKEQYEGEKKDLIAIKKHVDALREIYGLEPATGDNIPTDF